MCRAETVAVLVSFVTRLRGDGANTTEDFELRSSSMKAERKNILLRSALDKSLMGERTALFLLSLMNCSVNARMSDVIRANYLS